MDMDTGPGGRTSECAVGPFGGWGVSSTHGFIGELNPEPRQRRQENVPSATSHSTRPFPTSKSSPTSLPLHSMANWRIIMILYDSSIFRLNLG